jgi:hypothetical protein
MVTVMVGLDCVSLELWPVMGLLFISQIIHEWVFSTIRMTMTGENWRTQRNLSQCHFVHYMYLCFCSDYISNIHAQSIVLPKCV